MKSLLIHWKTNAQPLLTGALVLMPMLVADGGPWAGNKKAAWYVGAAIAATKVGIGMLQKDAGTEETDKGAQPSHETPNDPTAKVVTKE